MTAQGAIVEQWLVHTLAVYGERMASLAASERDVFRNPVGSTLRSQLTSLVDELLGAMDATVIREAFARITAVRAIQELTLEQAVGFVFALRAIVRAQLADADALGLDARIDRLALAAFEQYLFHRSRLSELRLNEQIRTLGPLPYRLRPGAFASSAKLVP